MMKAGEEGNWLLYHQPEVGIYKRKQESKNTRNTLSTKKAIKKRIKKKENTLSTKKATKKNRRKKIFFS